jgi:hypothetical protein
VYITDEENDKTFAKYRDMIERKVNGKITGITIVKIKYEEAFKHLDILRKAKELYEKIQKGEVQKSEEKRKVLLKFLNVSNFHHPAIHTGILFDDATGCIKNKKNPLHSLFLRYRHHKFTYFFNVHLFTKDAIPMTIKKNMRAFWYFGGYCKQDFNVCYPYIKAPVNREELYAIYRRMGKRDVLFLDYTDNGTLFGVIPLSQKSEENWFLAGEEDYEDEINEEDDRDEEEMLRFIGKKERNRLQSNTVRQPMRNEIVIND